MVVSHLGLLDIRLLLASTLTLRRLVVSTLLPDLVNSYCLSSPASSRPSFLFAYRSVSIHAKMAVSRSGADFSQANQKTTALIVRVVSENE